MDDVDARRLFDAGEFDQIASNINTGLDNPESSRALIVFNPTDDAISGAAVFHFDMPWRKGRTLPPVQISHYHSSKFVPCELSRPKFVEPIAGESHGRLICNLMFSAFDVPARGWDTYIAQYTTDSSPTDASLLQQSQPSPHLTVVETTRHDGVLDPVLTMR